MKAKLIVVGGDAKAAEISLKLPTVIGRGRGVTLTLPHPLVSRKHCEIFSGEGKLFVRDLGSLNGTFVNNERIDGDVELPSGELLTVGTVTFRAVYEDDPQLHPPTEAADQEVQPAASATVRDPASVTVDIAAGADTDDDIDDAEFAEFIDEDDNDIEEADELGEDEDWEEIDELDDEDLEDAEFEVDEEVEVVDEDVRATQPAAEAKEPDEVAEDDDDLNAFLQGLD